MNNDSLRNGGVACDNMLCRWWGGLEQMCAGICFVGSQVATCPRYTPDPSHPLTIAAREREVATKDVRPQTQKHDPDPLLALVRTAYKRLFACEGVNITDTITLPFTGAEAERFRELVRDGEGGE